MSKMKMKKILITGGKGDIAKSIIELFQNDYIILAPGREELNVRNLHEIENFLLKHSDIDILINNAGSIHPKTVKESNPNEWIKDIEVNLIAPYLTSYYALKHNCNVLIINITSTAGHAHYKDWSSYCTSKAGAITFTKTLAADGVNAFSISAGAVETKFRNKFNIKNDNMLKPEQIAFIIKDIISGEYRAGDDILIRKNEFKIIGI